MTCQGTLLGNIARERRKKLPEKVDFWDFDCRIGLNDSDAKNLHEKEINKNIEELVSKEVDSFYLEILVKPGIRKKKKSS